MTEPNSEYEPIVYIEEPNYKFELEQEIDILLRKKAIALAIQKNIRQRIIKQRNNKKILEKKK